MLERFGKSLRIGVSRTGIALVEASRWSRPRATLLVESRPTPEASANADGMAGRLRGVLAEAKCGNRSATIILDDDLVRFFMVAAPQNATRIQDCQAAAEMRFHALYGNSSEEWQLAADWNARHPFLVCAIPRALLTALRTAAGEYRLQVVAIVPQFVAAWNRWRPALRSDSWFGVVHDGMLTLGVAHAGRLCAVRRMRLPGGGGDEAGWLAGQLSREALRQNIPAPARVQLCGRMPGQWTIHESDTLTCERLDAEEHAEDVPLSALAALARTGMRA